MEKNMQEILNDLFMIDPELKSKEKEIIPIIEALLKTKPDTKFDENFARQLRAQLLAKASLALPPKPSKINNLFFMKKSNYLAFGLAAVILIVGGFYVSQKKVPNKIITQTGKQDSNSSPEELLKQIQEAPLGSQETQKTISQIRKFASKEEFVKFLENSQIGYGRGGGVGGGPDLMQAAPLGMGESLNLKSTAPAATDSGSARVSETNVQVLGIDEPDIVKTDGKNLFVSLQQYYPYYKTMESQSPVGIMPYRQPQEITNIISAFPADALKKIGKIDKQGDMLLYKDTLIIFTYEYVYGFDVKDKTNPKEAWKIKYENNSNLVTARLYEGKIYLVTQNYPDFSNPCPIRPLSVNGKTIEIACTDIYHPIVPLTDSVTYSAFVIDPASGEIKNKLSFVGSSGQAVVYMSQNSLYITYTYMEDQVKILLDFLKTAGKGIFPDAIISKIEKLNSYDISINSKMTELSQITEKYLNSIGSDERVKIENELQNKISDYIKAHKRDILFTGIAKIPLSKFEITETGSVPGAALNQFSLDEYKGNLRIAVTVGGNGVGMWGGWIYLIRKIPQ
ncbi:MAG: beta-propeller domain-containing protein [Candidatus Doudnabacteria bacterium]|nr:beta-propeller domain-containing protein [Candidatus Doudnabacteria bacterium]